MDLKGKDTVKDPEQAREIVDSLITKLASTSGYSSVTLQISENTPTDAPSLTLDRTEVAEILRVLKIQRNAFSAISRLPNEMLVEIFIAAKDSYINIARTCQRWRRIALGISILWSTPPTRFHDFTLLCLQRSKTAPLDISISRFTAFPTAAAIFKSHTERIRELYIEGQSGHYLHDCQTIISHLDRKALQLEELYIEKNWSDDTFTLSPEAFDFNATRMRRLNLRNIRIDWCMLFYFINLKYLDLYDVTVTHDVTPEEFAKALRGMPLLEELALSFGDIELRGDLSVVLSAEHIHLSKLTVLAIESRSPLHHIHQFLSHTTMPKLRELYIDYGDDRVNHCPMVRQLASTIANGNFTAAEGLRVSYGGITITAHSSVDIELLLPVTHGGNHFEMATQILACIAPRGPSKCSLAQLSLSSLILDTDQIRELFGHLPHLKHVCLFEDTALEFIEALDVPLDHLPGLPIPFPKVDTIELTTFRYGQTPYPDPQLWDALMDCSMQRYEYSVPMQTVALKGCKLAPDSVELLHLKEIVAEVTVSSSWI